MKPEVFFCTMPQSEHRLKLSEKMLQWWQKQDVKLHILTPKVLGCKDQEFQRLRRGCAEALAKQPLYIVTDDDMEPTTDIHIGIEALREHASFAMLSAFPSNCQIHRWTPENYDPYEDLDVMEHYSVGGLRVMRRGCMVKGWPNQSGVGYDTEHCEALRNSGYRVGYSQHFRAIHHGEGHSDLWTQTTSNTKKTISELAL